MKQEVNVVEPAAIVDSNNETWRFFSSGGGKTYYKIKYRVYITHYIYFNIIVLLLEKLA